VWERDLASNMLTWDATMFGIYGCTPLMPMPYERWSAAVCSEDLPRVEATLQRAIDQKSQGSAEYRINLPDGSVRNVSAVERVVLDERGNVSRLIGVDMDVTERKQAEYALEQIRKDELRFKDEFLSHVSHELRSPLTAIKQFSSILLGGLAGDLNKEQREYQEIVLKNIGQLQSMIDDLLEVTRLETGKLTIVLESVNLADAVTDTFNTLQETARARGVTLSFTMPPDLAQAYADQTRVRQILIILLDNAIKFTPEGGAVTVQARPQKGDPRFLLIEVSDTGCGISPESTERIFERLYQVSEPVLTSRKGLGLGLYICKELVSEQGGRIWAQRRERIGSTFSFTLPVFSLYSTIAGLLANDKWPSESAALVMVEAVWPDTWQSTRSKEEWFQDIQSTVQRCLLPDMDVLLPNMSPGAHWERIFLAAFADEAGTSVLVNRIRGQLERVPGLAQSGVVLSVSYDMLPPWPREAEATTEAILAGMATHLIQAITSHIFPGHLS
jgi:signal transduction histidine kinase